MGGIRLVAVLLIVAGAVGLAFGGYRYFQDSSASLGPIRVSVGTTRTVNIPIWVGLASLVVGGGLLFAGTRRHAV